MNIFLSVSAVWGGRLGGWHDHRVGGDQND